MKCKATAMQIVAFCETLESGEKHKIYVTRQVDITFLLLYTVDFNDYFTCQTNIGING